jgi:hypothetical protein
VRNRFQAFAFKCNLYPLHPGFEFVRFPSTYITVDLQESTCVSEDGLRVKFSVTFQYQLPVEWLVPVVVKYNDYRTWVGLHSLPGFRLVTGTYCRQLNRVLITAK